MMYPLTVQFQLEIKSQSLGGSAGLLPSPMRLRVAGWPTTTPTAGASSTPSGTLRASACYKGSFEDWSCHENSRQRADESLRRATPGSGSPQRVKVMGPTSTLLVCDPTSPGAASVCAQ